MNSQTIPELEIDFTENVGPLRPELHSSGLGGQLVGSASCRTSLLKPLHFFAARTHDWALVNAGQRMIDTHFVFPNPKADPEDPDNYFFGPTDEILSPTVASPVFLRPDEETFVFRIWDPASAAYPIAFE